MVINAREQAQQAGQLADVFVECVVSVQGVDQTRLADSAVAVHIVTPGIGGCIGHVFAAFAGDDHAQALQLFERVVDQVGVFHVHDEADIGQPLVAGAVGDVVQHQHIQRHQVLQPGCTHAMHHPAVKRVAGHDQAELELAHFGTAGRHQMRGGDDGVYGGFGHSKFQLDIVVV